MLHRRGTLSSSDSDSDTSSGTSLSWVSDASDSSGSSTLSTASSAGNSPVTNVGKGIPGRLGTVGATTQPIPGYRSRVPLPNRKTAVVPTLGPMQVHGVVVATRHNDPHLDPCRRQPLRSPLHNAGSRAPSHRLPMADAPAKPLVGDTLEMASIPPSEAVHPTPAQSTLRCSIRRLPLELLRCVSQYVTVHDLVVNVGAVCKAFRVEHRFWRQRWGHMLSRLSSLYNNVVASDPAHAAISKRVYAVRPSTDGSEGDVLVMSEPQLESIDATLHQLHEVVVLGNPAMPMGICAPPEHEDAVVLQKVMHFIESRCLDAMVPAAVPAKLRVVAYGPQTCTRDVAAEALVAAHIAHGLEWVYCNGYDASDGHRAEGDAAYRASVARNHVQPQRRGFGVVLPLYAPAPACEGSGGPAAARPSAADRAALHHVGLAAYPLSPLGTTRVLPLYHIDDLRVYWWILEHAVMSDVRHYAWVQEEKLGICGTLVSPSGGAAEVRMYAGTLHGSCPRFFINCVCTDAAGFPQETIAESYTSGKELFSGGYGRVEVDVAPRVHRANFEHLATQLRLRAAFPLVLLWNIVVGCTGCVPLLASHIPSFLELFEHRTFEDVAAAQLA